MRLSLFALVIGLLAFGAMLSTPGTATAEKSKMGCDTATEVWNAALGKCEPGSPKYKKGGDKTAAAKKEPAKKAPAKKAPPAPK